jgi:phage baseplate assembly protein V
VRHARASRSISGMNIAEITRLLENIVRFGTIEAVQMQPPRVKVKSGNIATTWLPWLNLRAGADREWDPPTIGEQVVLLSPSGNLAQGVVLTGLFSDVIPANGDREGLHRRTYRDGAVIEYDSIAKRLLAVLPTGGKAQLTAPGGVTILGNVDITGTVTVSADVVASGISLVTHKHGGVQTGSGTTAVPK